MTKDKDTHKPKQSHKAHKKVFDVVPPGKAPASPTSRPVIVGHKPPVKDHQFTPNTPSGNTSPATSSQPSYLAGDPAEPRSLMNHHQQKGIDPFASAAAAEPDSAGSQPPSKHETVVQEALAGTAGSAAESSSPPTPAQSADSKSPATVPGASSPSLTERLISTAPPADDTANPESIDPKLALEQLAVEQVVETDQDTSVDGNTGGLASAPAEGTSSDGSAEGEVAPGASSPPNPSSASAAPTTPEISNAPIDPALETNPSNMHEAKSTDDLLAETGPPDLDLPFHEAVVSQHHRGMSAGKWLLVLVLVILLAAATLNFLIDAEILSLNVPHTDLL